MSQAANEFESLVSQLACCRKCRRIHYVSTEIGESRDCPSSACSAVRFDCLNRAAQLDRRDFRLCRFNCSFRSNRRCCRVAVVDHSEKPIDILAGFPVAFVNSVRLVSKSFQAAATAFRLSHESKLRQVLHELKIDSLLDTAPHKQQLLSRVAKYLDIFAECDSDVGTTNLTFHEIETGDVRLFRQPVSRLPYGEMRSAVEFEVD